MTNRCNNRIILDVADFGLIFPTMQELNDFSIEPWRQQVEEAKDHPTEYFEKSVFVDIHLPIRMNGEWLLLICSPFMKENHIVVFNKWGWEHPEVIATLEKMAEKLKTLILRTRLPIVG
jgi:hypothetical protein